jgi:two-component system repressor protein LuxO
VKNHARILIIEDTASLAMSYAAQLESAGHEVDVVGTGAAAMEKLAEATNYDVVLLDLQLPDCDGLELLGRKPDLTTTASVIVATADGSINRAISAMRLGAYDFLVKPLAPERLMTTVRNAFERRALAQEVKAIRAIVPRDHFHRFVGRSNVMQAVYRAIENVADSRATVFIGGESGTGKELAAEAIHRSGKRRDKAFVAINCGAIPENLLESELFGHVRGAFTGATDNRIGAAKEADGGTLFLDEICEMDIKLQVKLLRFLQSGTIQRVGSDKAEPVDVRIVCATNRDPAREVAEGRFREDLFYRLAVIPLDMPPLRDRDGDIELIAETFLRRFAEEESKSFDPLSPVVRDMLSRHSWPGNVRELQNMMRRAVVMNPGPDLGTEQFALASVSALPRATTNTNMFASPAIDLGPATGFDFAGMTLDAIERHAIEGAIIRANGSIPTAARNLGISPSTLYRKRERWAHDLTEVAEIE